MSNFELASGESYVELQQPVMSKKAALALVGGLAVATGLLGVTSSGSLEHYCAQREELAPGGHASQAPACEGNERVRDRVAPILDMPDFTFDTNRFKLFDQSR